MLENYYPHIGGVETLFKTLVEQLAQQGHQVTVVTGRPTKNTPKKEDIGNLHIRRYDFHNRYIFTFFAWIPLLFYVRKCDLVHTTSYNAGLPAFIAAKLFRKPIFITFHECWVDLWERLPFMSPFGKHLHRLYEKMLISLPFDRFVAVSKSTAINLKKGGVLPNRILTIYNGIDYQVFTNLKKDIAVSKKENFTLTYFGRLGMSKGLDLLMQAVAILKKEGKPIPLQLIIPREPKPILQYIEKVIAENNLENWVTLKHYLPFKELVAELLASHAVVIPSYSEGFCFAAVESMALGVPIISSQQTALEEVVSGQFIAMKSFSKEHLVEAIENAKAGNWEKTPLRRFPLEQTIQSYLNLYHNDRDLLF